MRITLLRHPHTEFHNKMEPRRVRHDPPISLYGRRQLDNFIGTLPIGLDPKWDHVFSSNLQRALYPAREIAAALNVGHTSYPFLNEVDWDPDWEDALYDHIHPKIEQWQNSKLFYDYEQGPGGKTERFEDHRERVAQGWESLMDSLGCPDSYCGQSQFESILVVSHHLTISNIISHMLGIRGRQHPFDLGFLKSVTLYRTTFGLWRINV